MRIMRLIGIWSALCGAIFGQQRDWTVKAYSSTLTRHEVRSPGSFEVDGNKVTFLYKGITETAEIPEYHDKPSIYIDTKGKVIIEPEFWAADLDRAMQENERDEEWQRKGYPVEFRAFMVRTLKQLSVEKALGQF